MTDREIAVKVTNVHKTFKLPHEKVTSIKSAVVNIARHNKSYEKLHVLKDISFTINKGEFFGIVGRNGSGKSTLLKLLAGIYTPDKGVVQVNGKLTPFIELGVGFNPELTGRENVFLNGALLGFSRKEMEAMYDDIVSFAELKRFMDQKLKNYSSGMQVRLAFSIAIRANTDVLILDEVLAVGDALFQKRCFEYFKELKKNKRTVIFVSHDAAALQEYCTRGALIDQGKIVMVDDIMKVVNTYVDILNEQEESTPERRESSGENRWGTRVMEVESIWVGGSGQQKKVFTDNDDAVCIRVTYGSNGAITEPVYGISIQDAAGQMVFQSNTLWQKIHTKSMEKGDVTEVTWEVPNIFNTGEFRISPAVANRTGAEIFDWRDQFGAFKIRKQTTSGAVTNVRHVILLNNIGG